MGNNLNMILERLTKLPQHKWTFLEKIKWLKIWNYDKAKHVISFPIDIIGHVVLNAWITQKTLRWQVLFFSMIFLVLYAFIKCV